MHIKAIRTKFYKHELKLLNLISLVILIINGIKYFNQSLNFLGLLWSSICIAATIFIDCCQSNVFRELAKKKIAVMIIAIIIVMSITTVVVSLIKI